MSFTVGLRGCTECGEHGHGHGQEHHRHTSSHGSNAVSPHPCPNARTSYYSIFTAAAQGELARVKQILRSKSPNVTDSGGYTALHYAAQQNHAAVVKYLCESGANVNAAECGATPLHRAAYSGALESVALLVQHRADVWKRDAAQYARGRMAHHKAAAQGHAAIVAFLLQHEPRLAIAADTDGKLAADLANTFSISISPHSSLNEARPAAVEEALQPTASTAAMDEQDGAACGFDCPCCSSRVYSGKLSRCCRRLLCEECAGLQRSTTRCALCSTSKSDSEEKS